jgi:nicotinamidase/pyrazinamidase
VDYGKDSALIVVDVQNDFADPAGSLYVPGGEETVVLINEQITLARDAGAVVVYTQDWHPESTPHFEKDGGIWPVHCVAETRGADLHPDLEVIDDAIRIRKGVGGEDGYSAFHIRDAQTGEKSTTGLASRLEEEKVEKVVVVGLALDYCVKETALDAAKAGFGTTLLADGTRAVNLKPGDGARAAAEMAAGGVEVA